MIKKTGVIVLLLVSGSMLFSAVGFSEAHNTDKLKPVTSTPTSEQKIETGAAAAAKSEASAGARSSSNTEVRNDNEVDVRLRNEGGGKITNDGPVNSGTMTQQTGKDASNNTDQSNAVMNFGN